MTWRLEGSVNVGPGLEIKPYIVYSDLGLNKEGLVASQEDRCVRHVLLHSFAPSI